MLSASTVSDAQLGLTGLPVNPLSSEAVLGERGGEPLRFGSHFSSLVMRSANCSFVLRILNLSFLQPDNLLDPAAP